MSELELYAGCDGLIHVGIHILPRCIIVQCLEDVYSHISEDDIAWALQYLQNSP
jgi:hypothetical protein